MLLYTGQYQCVLRKPIATCDFPGPSVPPPPPPPVDPPMPNRLMTGFEIVKVLRYWFIFLLILKFIEIPWSTLSKK